MSFKIKNEDKNVILFTLIIGLLAHSFMVFNKISFFDDLSSIYGFSAKHLFSLGRFTIAFLKIINDKLFNPFSSPIINGIVSLLLISLSNVLIARIFNIKNTIDLILLSCIIILSTGYICLQAYLFTAVYYTFAIFLSILSTYIFLKHSRINVFNKIILVAFLQMFVISIYQSYFLFGIILFIIYQIYDLLNNRFGFRKSVEYFSSIFIALVLYYSINKFLIFILNLISKSFLKIDTSISISNYQGLNKFLNFSALPSFSFGGFITKLFAADSILYENNYFIFIILYILVFILYIYIFINSHFDSKSIILIIFYTVLLIIVSNSLYILDDLGTNLYALPMFPKCLLFLLPLVILEHSSYRISFVIYVLLFYYLLYNIILSNNIYLNRYFALENEKRWCTTLVSRIQSTHGYTDDYDIYVYGDKIGASIIKHDNHYANSVRFIKTFFPYNTDSINTYNFESFLEYYSGFKAWSFHKNDKSFDTSFIVNMPCYPDDGSIQVVDNKIIIKFSDFKD